MQIKIVSDSPIDGLTLQKIRDIFKESLCPNESMFFSIPNFNSFKDNVVTLGFQNRKQYMEVFYCD